MRSNTLGNLAFGLSILAAPSEAFWRMSCPGRLVRERADPIVNPGAVAGHLHTISGGNGFGFDMNFDQARASQCSSCSIKQDFSNYWTPQLFFKAKNGSFTPVPVVGDGNDQNGGMTVYYLQRGDAGEKLHGFPKNFRMLAGDTDKRNFTGGLDAQAVNYACLGAGKGETNEIPNYNCPGGLRAQIFFPACWDGVNLDSTNHKSHMSYPAGKNFNNGPCPASHPVHLISIFFEILYDTNRFVNEWYDGHHPFIFSNGDTTGYGFHGDFVNGWDTDVLQAAVDDCTNASGRVEDCNHFTQYTGAECQACRLPSLIDEQTDGWLEALPGCNPVTNGPEPAQKISNCGAPTTIGLPETFFTDLTVSKKWEYVGCGIDQYNSRTFTGKSQSNDQMTVEKCVDFCKSNGFSYAGLEYSRECYCDNSLAAARAPVDGVMGNCQMKCAGDSGQYCGGAGALSIYHACGSTCENAQYGVVGNYTTPATSPGVASSVAPVALSSATPVKSSTGSIRTAGTNGTPTVVTSVKAADVTPSATQTPQGYPGDAQVPGGETADPIKAPSGTVAQPVPVPSAYNPDEWDCGEDDE